jgi:hypothetical protein
MGDRRPGFVPGRVVDGERKWGQAPANPPMSIPDPNADLIGTTFPVNGGMVTVTGSCSWNPAYVAVDTPAGPSCRVAAQVRRRKEIQ